MGVINFCRNPEKYTKTDIILFSILSVAGLLIFLSLTKLGKSDVITKLPTTDIFSLSAFKLMLKKRLRFYAVFFINLKNFKHINRIVGSDGGDEVLYLYAKRLRNFLLPKELIARLGGDNFIVLIYKHRANEFIELLKNIKVDIDGESPIKNLSVYSRAGIYTLSDRDSVAELFNYSSIALTYAKNSNREDFVWFQKFMLEQTYEEKEIAYIFVNAIQQKKFKVYYQPRVNAMTNQICGAEALVRWDRDGKIVLPETFLLSLERSGLITTLDFYVMEQVCIDINSWKQKELPIIPISSNFSKPNLQDKDFVHRIMAMISKYKIESSLFQVEMTESPAEDLDLLEILFEQLHISGISTMVDDFGSGGFSWKLLKNPNVDAIKLDKTLVENIEVNGGANDDALLLRNIIHACCDLKKEIICEGVENSDQRDMIVNMHCTEIQGFLYDEPLPIEEFEKVLEKKVYGKIGK